MYFPSSSSVMSGMIKSFPKLLITARSGTVPPILVHCITGVGLKTHRYSWKCFFHPSGHKEVNLQSFRDTLQLKLVSFFYMTCWMTQWCYNARLPLWSWIKTDDSNWLDMVTNCVGQTVQYNRLPIYNLIENRNVILMTLTREQKWKTSETNFLKCL